MSTPPPRERRSGAERKPELVDAAIRVIGRAGIGGLTTAALAAEVGLSSGALFKHFPSLDALLGAVVDRVESALEASYPSADLAPLDRLLEFVALRSAAVGSGGILRLLLSEHFLLAVPAADRARITAAVERSFRWVGSCIREAQEAGTVRTDLDARALGMVVIGTVQAVALGGQLPFSPLGFAGAPVAREALARLLRPATVPPPSVGRRPKRGASGPVAEPAVRKRSRP